MILFYWGGAMIGRFIGWLVPARSSVRAVLASVARGIMLILVSANSTATTSAYSLLRSA